MPFRTGSVIHPKVKAASGAGLVTVVLAVVAQLLSVDVPPEVASAVSTLAAALAGYLKSSG